MSKTKFNNIIRAALWGSYNNVCFYCNKPLDWDDLHLDHIVPEYLIDNPGKFEVIKKEYELNENFEINALYNLVPTHSKCNSRKSDELFVKKTTLYYLGLTNKAQIKIQNEIEKLQKRKNKGQIISKLQSALATNLIDIHELHELYTKAQEDNWKTTAIKIPLGVEFIDEVYDTFYLNTDWASLFDKELLIGGSNCELELKKDSSLVKYVSTLNGWKNAIIEGYYPATTLDIKMSSSFTFFEEFINALNTAKMPKISFVSEPWLGVDSLNYLSPDLLVDFENKLEKYIRDGVSVGRLIDEGIVIQNPSDIYTVALEFDGMETSLMEQFRADFNNDGIEDIFVRGWTRAVGGTLGFGFTSILTRYSNKHLIERIK